MRRAIAAASVVAAASIPPGPVQVDAAEPGYAWPIERVVDGDTVKVRVPGLPPGLALLSVRLRGVDAPETRRAECEAERTAGAAAAAFLRDALAGARVVFRDPRWGKYGGRAIADAMVDGRPLAAMLIEAGHGRPHDGGRREGWCG